MSHSISSSIADHVPCCRQGHLYSYLQTIFLCKRMRVGEYFASSIAQASVSISSDVCPPLNLRLCDSLTTSLSCSVVESAGVRTTTTGFTVKDAK